MPITKNLLGLTLRRFYGDSHRLKKITEKFGKIAQSHLENTPPIEQILSKQPNTHYFAVSKPEILKLTTRSEILDSSTFKRLYTNNIYSCVVVVLHKEPKDEDSKKCNEVLVWHLASNDEGKPILTQKEEFIEKFKEFSSDGRKIKSCVVTRTNAGDETAFISRVNLSMANSIVRELGIVDNENRVQSEHVVSIFLDQDGNVKLQPHRASPSLTTEAASGFVKLLTKIQPQITDDLPLTTAAIKDVSHIKKGKNSDQKVQ